jgi:hypothetical protein
MSDAKEKAKNEFCWLIEAPGPRYLTAYEWQHDRRFEWTPSPHLAIRFHSKEQADNTMMAVRQLVPDLFAFAACLGIDAKPIEHGFLP